MTQSLMLNALVVDDEPPAQRRLTDLLGARDDIKQVDVCDNGRDAINAIRSNQPDVVFLDVQMPDCTGIEVVNEVGAENMPIVIFVTAYDQHALKAFELAALDYLLKPFEDERFHEALDRAARQVEMRSADQLEHQLERLLDVARPDLTENENEYLQRIPVRTRNEVRIVTVDDIMYCAADGPYVRLHLHNEDTYLIRERMKVLEEQKPDMITLDLEMPEEWGPRFFRKISKKGYTTPVIVISGLSGRKHSIPKAEGFVAKPFDADEVLEKVRQVLRR